MRQRRQASGHASAESLALLRPEPFSWTISAARLCRCLSYREPMLKQLRALPFRWVISKGGLFSLALALMFTIGALTVSEISNRALLESIAKQTGGEVIAADQLDGFAAGLPNRKAPITESWSYPLWHQPAVFLFALACFVAEWGLRRSKGMA